LDSPASNPPTRNDTTSDTDAVRRVRGFLAGAMLLIAGLAAAQVPPPTPDAPLPWRLTISGVWYSGTTPYRLVGASSGDVHFDSAGGWGARLSHDVLPWFDVGVSWTHVVTDLRLAGPESLALGSRQINTMEAGGDFHWVHGPLRLSFLTGIGGAGTGTAKGSINLTASVGAGASFSLDRHLAVSFAERWRATYGNLAPGDRYAFCDETGCYAYRSKFYENREAVGGLTLVF